jgi:superfamily II DNA or RNA helicase
MATLPFDAPFTAKPLRPHQETAIALLRRAIGEGKKRIVVQMPTGAGKTRTAAEIVTGALGKGNKVCFTVPAISLIDQTVEAFESEGIFDLGVIQASHPRTHYGMPVQVASVQTLARRSCPPVDVIVVDECHLRFDAISDWMKREPGKIFIGLSATPWARGMADDWDHLVAPVRMQELIDAGFLSPFRVFAPSHPDLSGVKTVAGDYHEGELAEVMSDNRLVADVVDTWVKRGDGRPTLVFAVNRAHARHLQERFAAAGVQMGYCDAYVDRIERAILFDRMARGELSGIVNVGTLTTGVDADVRCIVMARPTKSEMLFVQCIGRGLRTAPGKADCLILDHADNHARLGFVTDIHHAALLSGKDKRPLTRKEKGEALPKECPSCGILKAPKVRECPSCGFTPSHQSEVETEEGELIEIKRGKVKASMADKQAFYSGLLEMARLKGRSKGWAAHTYRKRFSAWPHHSLSAVPTPPSPEVIGWVRHLDIAFAKTRGKAA